MNLNQRPRMSRALPAAVGAAVACTLGACQSYEPVPLDLGAHRASLELRSQNTEPVARFAERLAAGGGEVPERFDVADGLSPAEGEVLALFYNPNLRLARARAGVARATAETAGLWEDPTFGFDAAEILSPAGVFEYGLTIGLTLPVSGRLAVEKDRAGAAYEAELRGIVDAEWTTRARVRTAWTEWSVAQARAELLGEVIGHTERIGSIADRLEGAGELTRVEARLIRAELVTTRGERIAAERDAATKRLELLSVMGLPPTADAAFEPEFSVPPVVPGDLDASRLIEANTTIAVRRAEYRTAEEALRLEVRKQYPDIAVGTGYGSEDSDDRLLLGLSLPVPMFNANRGGIAEARAERDAARVAAETTYELLVRELAEARLALDAARRQREAFELELVPMLDEQSLEVERLADLGEIDTLVLLETVTRGYEAKRTLLDLRQEEMKAAIEIARLLGPTERTDPTPIEASALLNDGRAGERSNALLRGEEISQ